MKFLTDGFTSAATAKVGTSAIETRKLGYLLWSDVVVPHKDELLYVATQQVKAMYESGWRAPMKRLFPVAGRNAIATIKAQLVNMRDGGFISRPRLPHRDADRRRRVRRRRRCRLAGERGIPDDDGARALLRPARAPEDAGTDHGHAADRQAGSQLRSDEMTQASAGRLHRRRDAHADRPLGPRLFQQHASRRSADRGDQERDEAGAERSTRRRSRTRSSAARSRKASRA